MVKKGMSSALQEYSTRKRLTKGLPVFAGLPRAPVNNTPKTIAHDSKYIGWYNQVTEVQRVLCVTYLQLTQSESLDTFDLVPPREQLQSAFIMLQALCQAIHIFRLTTLDSRLMPEAEAEVQLVKKEDMSLLERKFKVENRFKNYNSYSSFRRSPYGYNGKGKGKGKGKGGGKGKGAHGQGHKPTFSFQQGASPAQSSS